jgi:hypothetical protein
MISKPLTFCIEEENIQVNLVLDLSLLDLKK